ncbi:zinc finger MYM-type protein 1-like [Acropora millepora]|uniref:zinc finger MYM-type protein 1-like n=1 Tax=Acropora millepora TaxID=45264 RepID=UPI001CF4FEB8|nr:zinc finger MYM-type protein 1-like [Acropora millepora]
MSMALQFVNRNKAIRKEFVGFHLCEEGTSGRAIKEMKETAVTDLGLSMDDCRGQCYDGAGNMAGQLNGASSSIAKEHGKAMYVHCMSHRLNLCVADNCSLQIVKNMMTTIRKLSELFDNSPKHQQHLVEKIEEQIPDKNHRVIINICRTRWVARIDGMDRIVVMLLPVASAL